MRLDMELPKKANCEYEKAEAYLPVISPSAFHTPSSPSLHILILPSNPALAARRASLAVTRWWIPSVCTPSSDCKSGKSACVVSCMCIEEAPLAERTDFGVGASAKISDGWASDIVCRVRYCFDCACNQHNFLTMKVWRELTMAGAGPHKGDGTGG